MKNVYALQPYQVGSKKGKSLAIVIPATIARKYNIDTSTIFTLKGSEDRRIVTLQTINGIQQNHGDSSASSEYTLESRNS